MGTPLATRERWFAIATATLAGCLVGAAIGYSIGYFLFDSVGQWALSLLGYEQAFAEFSSEFKNDGFVTLLLVGITPIPFQVGMLTAGSTGYSFMLFMLASFIARGIRYYVSHCSSIGWGSGFYRGGKNNKSNWVGAC